MTLEIIMAAYNNAATMRLVLEGYLRQTDGDFRLCVADDGSGPEIAALVEEMRVRGLPIRHIWQEDRGFRKAEIVNHAIATSEADYIVLTDNDCIPARWFVADHKAWARPGHFVAGRRVDTKAALARQLLMGMIDPKRLDSFAYLLWLAARGQLTRAEKALRPPAWLAALWGRKPQALLGANIGVWRHDLLAVNGFDNDFQGYGGEEVDLEWRLLAYGVEPRAARGRACLYHVYHPERQGSRRVFEMLEAKRRGGHWVAERGIVMVTES